MDFARVFGSLVGLMTVILLVTVPEAVEASRDLLPDGAPVPPRFAAASRCYYLTFTPKEFGQYIDWSDHGTVHRVLNFTHLEDSVTVGHRPMRREDWSDDGRDLAASVLARARWRMAGTDSIQVVVPQHWYVGYTLRLSIGTDRLQGHAWTWSDAPGGTVPGAAVRAEPVDCGMDRLAPSR